MTESLTVGDAFVTYSVRGDGPGLLVPWCNFPWPDMPFVDVLAQRFTVVLASPRGYQGSARLPGAQGYSADLVATDLLAVCDHVGFDAFSVLGYSLTAAMAGWLATMTSRVDAIVLGGFPLLGSYEAVLRGAETANVAPHDFDPAAALAFYRDLATRPAGFLVDVECPVLAFWGSDDAVLQQFDATPDYGRALTERGIETVVLDGGDHVTTILRFGEAVEHVTNWVENVTNSSGR